MNEWLTDLLLLLLHGVLSLPAVAKIDIFLRLRIMALWMELNGWLMVAMVFGHYFNATKWLLLLPKLCIAVVGGFGVVVWYLAPPSSDDEMKLLQISFTNGSFHFFSNKLFLLISLPKWPGNTLSLWGATPSTGACNTLLLLLLHTPHSWISYCGFVQSCYSLESIWCSPLVVAIVFYLTVGQNSHL